MADSTTAQAIWSISDWFSVLGFGATAGAIGQVIRTVAGLKKLNDTADAASASVYDLIQPARLLVSLVIGAVAGALAATTIVKSLTGVSGEQFFGLAGAGYAGADFIEGFMNRVAPNAGVGGMGDGAVG